MSLMSLALATFFGGGPANSGAGHIEDGLNESVVSSFAVEAQAPAGGNTASAETRLSPETVWALIEGGSTPASEQMAGPVDVAYAAETGGQTEGAAERGHVGGGEAVTVSHARSSVYRALAEEAGDLPFESILTSAATTGEEAVAPAYGELAATGAAITRMALEGRLGVQTQPVSAANELPFSPQAEASETSGLQAFEQAGFVETDERLVPPTRATQPEGPVQPAGSALSEAALLADAENDHRATAGESVRTAGEVRENTGEPDIATGETETSEDVEPVAAKKPGTLVLPVADAAGKAVEAAAEPEIAPALDRESLAAADAIRSARKMAETLLRESLKRLPRSVEMRLDPPQLGSVTALLSQRGQEVTVKFIAHSNEAQRALESATEDLARALSDRGLTLTGFTVDPGYSGEKGREHRHGTQRPSTSRFHRTVRPLAVAGTQAFRQPVGAFNWLA